MWGGGRSPLQERLPPQLFFLSHTHNTQVSSTQHTTYKPLLFPPIFLCPFHLGTLIHVEQLEILPGVPSTPTQLFHRAGLFEEAHKLCCTGPSLVLVKLNSFRDSRCVGCIFRSAQHIYVSEFNSQRFLNFKIRQAGDNSSHLNHHCSPA